MRRGPALAAALVLGLLGGCGAQGDEDEEVLTVLAASSLTEAFEELEPGFEAQHGVDVRFSFGSSTTLAQQWADGAPGHVLATADEVSMAIARDSGLLAGEPVGFASNALVLVAGRDSEVRTWADLAGSRWVRCADDVPCGRAALELLDRTPPAREPASLEVDAKSVLGKVASGEADAGLAYATDAVAAADAVRMVEVPGPPVTTDYLCARVAGSGVAQAWIDLLGSPEGRRVLRGAGFTVTPDA